MSTDHRKPVVAFVMLALAAALVIGVQQAEAQGGRLLAAPAGVGTHVQGTIVSPTETLDSRDYGRLVDLGPTLVSLREVVGHADARTVAPETDRTRGAEPAAAGPGASAAAPTRTSPGTGPSGKAGSGTRPSGQAGPDRRTPVKSAPARKPGKAANGRASRKQLGYAGKASTSSATSSSGKARKAAGRGQSRKPVAVQRSAVSWKPGKAHRSVTKASPWSAMAHRSARPATPPARVATTSRATGVHRSAWHHRGARGKR